MTVGEKRQRDGKKKRIPVRGVKEPHAVIKGMKVPIPKLESLSKPRFNVMEWGVRFWADWNCKQMTWNCGSRIDKAEMLRTAAAAFCDAHWGTYAESPKKPEPWPYIKGRMMSLLVEEWKESEAWDDILEKCSRVFRVQEVLRT